MDNIIAQIVQGGIAFSILILVVWYLKEELKKKDKQIEALQTELRESEKDNLTLLYKVVGFMEKGEKNFDDLKAFIQSKIDELKNL